MPLPDPQKVDGADPDAVSRAAVTVMWTMDTTIDTSQYQAELRAAPYLTADYAARLRQYPPVAAPGAQWNQWAAHRAYTTVRLTPGYDDRPLDTATTAHRQWSVTATPIGRDGWRGQPVTATVFVTLTRTGPGQPWRVAAVTVAP
ncbi:hypothetical protein [Carbonactinospora thermoautotrophica]|uniref:hypothetical protein n=1 Tax=Carbonactinospora thermoautotrophica TaxID=1469144 RepID=UPI00082DABE6|nr:hypothetical protein [Carbonactinospora thermoautotrophica]